MSDDGHGTDPRGAVRRYAGSLRCRPVVGATPDPGPEDWRFDILQAGGGIVVTEVAGEIDLRTSGFLRKRLFELTDAGFARIVIDFEHVRFCDAAGLGVLVAAQNRLRGHPSATEHAADKDNADRDRAADQDSGAGRDRAADRSGAPGQGNGRCLGAIALARVRPAQRRLLHVAGLDRAFALYDSVPDAVRAQPDPSTASLG